MRKDKGSEDDNYYGGIINCIYWAGHFNYGSIINCIFMAQKGALKPRIY